MAHVGMSDSVLTCCTVFKPQGTIVDMLEDVNTGVGWVMQKISNYGGDPERVYLVGQSCGGQLCSLATLIQVCLPAVIIIITILIITTIIIVKALSSQGWVRVKQV